MEGPIVFIVSLYFAMWGLTRFLKGFNRDSTDTAKDKRSGLHVMTDYGTGVQYVCDPFGGICLRVKADGAPFTVADDQKLLEVRGE